MTNAQCPNKYSGHGVYGAFHCAMQIGKVTIARKNMPYAKAWVDVSILKKHDYAGVLTVDYVTEKVVNVNILMDILEMHAVNHMPEMQWSWYMRNYC